MHVSTARDPNVYSFVEQTKTLPFLSQRQSIYLLGPNITFPYPFLFIRFASLS